MSTTCQQIYVRAKQSSPANADLVSIPTEVLARIDAEQQAIFASIASVTRDRFQTTATLRSTAGSSVRVVDLSDADPPIERLLTVTLADGRVARQVDVIDPDAELAPRYVVRGETLVEVSNDWSTATGALTVTIVYVYGPTTISPSGDYTQTISLPDAWADLLVLPLQKYFAQQRPATSPNEIAMLDEQLGKRSEAFLDYLTNYGGVKAKRFDIPVPKVADKK